MKRLLVLPLLCCSCNLAYHFGASTVGEGAAAIQQISKESQERIQNDTRKLETLTNGEREKVLAALVKHTYEKFQASGMVGDVLRQLADPTSKCRTPNTSLGGISEWCSVAKAKIAKWALISALIASGVGWKVGAGMGGIAALGGGTLLTVLGLVWKSRSKLLDYVTKQNAKRRATGVSSKDMESELKDAKVYDAVSGRFKQKRAELTAKYLEEKDAIQNGGAEKALKKATTEAKT